MMKKIVSILLLVSMLILASCEKRYNANEINQDESLYSKNSVIKEYEEVSEAFDSSTDISGFCSKMNIDNYKKEDDICYTVVRTDDGYLLASFYDDGETKYLRRISFSPADNLSSIERIKKSMTITDVKQADSYGNFDYLYASWSEFPQTSIHFFENGDTYLFVYEDDIIVDIIHFTI